MDRLKENIEIKSQFPPPNTGEQLRPEPSNRQEIIYCISFWIHERNRAVGKVYILFAGHPMLIISTCFYV